MTENKGERSTRGTELVRGTQAAVRFVRAVNCADFYAVTTTVVKEGLPIAAKTLLALLIFLITFPMVVFTALPNLFFGFSSSESDAVQGMTEQAQMVGGAYLSLSDLEQAQIDAVVTAIIAEYEQENEESADEENRADGEDREDAEREKCTIDRVVVTNTMTEDDLLWLIAIHSVAYGQDLSIMSGESIRSFCTSGVSYVPTLGLTGEGIVTTTLWVRVERPKPEELMEELGFDEKSERWARALYELMVKSDALTRYAAYSDNEQPSYGGDGSYVGDIQYGEHYGNEIDISGFVDPTTKNNQDLAAYAIQAWENNWGYVWGTFGNVLTPSLFAYKKEQYPDGVGNYAAFIQTHWLGRRTADCIGLIKGYGWLDPETLTICYGTNGMPDYGANQMYRAVKGMGRLDEDYGELATMPELVGLMLWKDGHVGIYIGNGEVIEAMGTTKGVVKTKVDERGWQSWCKLPYINYLEVTE